MTSFRDWPLAGLRIILQIRIEKLYLKETYLIGYLRNPAILVQGKYLVYTCSNLFRLVQIILQIRIGKPYLKEMCLIDYLRNPAILVLVNILFKLVQTCSIIRPIRIGKPFLKEMLLIGYFCNLTNTFFEKGKK